MTNQEAIRLIRNHPTMCEFPDAYGKPYYDAVDMAIKALEATSPCDLCVNNPPSSMDGKPCSCCPAKPYRKGE